MKTTGHHRPWQLRIAVVVTLSLTWGLPAGASTPRAVAGGTAAPAATAPCPPLLQHTFPRLQDEKPQPLCQYAGKVLLVVNTASKCGFTPQYEGLEALHAKYAARGLVVMGFPSNDFGSQEPGTREQIADLCFNTYGVKFPMFAKTQVKGDGAHPFFKTLVKEADRAPRWNFYKYLIDRQGRVVDSFSSMTEPMDGKLTRAVEKALAAAP